MADDVARSSSRAFGAGPMARVASPDPDFDDFFRAHYRSVVAFAYSLCRSWPVAEEVAQEAFAAAHRKWRQVGAYELPAGWVRRVAANHCASIVRRRVAEARAARRALNGRSQHSKAVEPSDDALWAAVNELPRRQAEIVSLRYVGGHSLQEISELLGLAPSTVRVHMHRARITLAARLDLDPGEG